MTTVVDVQAVRISFWAKMMIAMSVFIAFSFAQFGLRGLADYTQTPTIFHVHGMAMLAWLALACTQSVLARRGPDLRALHRKLGWASAAMLPLLIVLASLTCLTALRVRMAPPFLTPAYFFALVHVTVLAFALTVVAAIARRRQADWHKRLMIGATILLMDPALGRVLPLPFIKPWGEWLAMAIELGVALIVVRHDRRVLGRVHPATIAVILVIGLTHVLVELLAITPWWIAFVQPFIV